MQLNRMSWDILFLASVRKVPAGVGASPLPGRASVSSVGANCLEGVRVGVGVSSISRSLSLEGARGPSGSCSSRENGTRERKGLTPGVEEVA